MAVVLFTFDYELFLGDRSGNARDCILDPTSRLLALLRRYEFKAIFFVDTVYLMRLQEMASVYPKAAEDLEELRRQITEIARQGHNVFPHIHAHWLDAVYLPDRNEWSLQKTRYYQFSSLGLTEQERLFDGSIQIIRDLLPSAWAEGKIDAYRAGGWSIQPFSAFRPFFLRNAIAHEWSVIPGKYHFSDAHSFDFRKAPAGRPVYRFGEDPCLPDPNGPFTEWTISTIRLTSLEKWFNFKVSGLLRRLGKTEPRKGSTVSSVTSEQGDIYGQGDHLRVTASFEGLNPFILMKYRRALRSTDYFQFISHPKLLSSFEFTMIEKLFRTLKKDGKIETDFRKVNV